MPLNTSLRLKAWLFPLDGKSRVTPIPVLLDEGDESP